MFRRSLPFLVIIALAVFIFLAIFKKSTETYIVKVSFPVMTAMEQIRNTHKISKWMEPFASEKESRLSITPQGISLGNESLQIINQGYDDMKFMRSNGKDSLVYLVEAYPLADTAGKTNFVLSYVTTPWKKYIGKNPLINESMKNMDLFKAFLENPGRVYGYDIKEILVTDTSFLFASRTVPLDKFAPESKSLFDMLIAEAGKKNAGYNGVRIFHSQLMGDGTIGLFAGIGVTRRVNTSENDIVTYKIMPYKKKLLVAEYVGPYKNIQQAYDAMELYKTDNKRVSMAIPFEKYLSDGYGFADTQVVKMRVSFPVF